MKKRNNSHKSILLPIYPLFCVIYETKLIYICNADAKCC
jgi:hypothetical protein